MVSLKEVAGDNRAADLLQLPRGLYQENHGVTIIRVQDRLGAVKADRADSRALGVRAGEPLLEITRVAYTFNGWPVETRNTRVRTQDYRYLMEQGSSL